MNKKHSSPSVFHFLSSILSFHSPNSLEPRQEDNTFELNSIEVGCLATWSLKFWTDTAKRSVLLLLLLLVPQSKAQSAATSYSLFPRISGWQGCPVYLCQKSLKQTEPPPPWERKPMAHSSTVAAIVPCPDRSIPAQVLPPTPPVGPRGSISHTFSHASQEIWASSAMP